MESVENRTLPDAHVQTFTARCRGEEYRWRCFVGGTKPPNPKNGDVWLESEKNPAVYWDCKGWVVEVLGEHHRFPREDGTHNANIWLWKGHWHERTSVTRNIAKWSGRTSKATATTGSQTELSSDGDNVLEKHENMKEKSCTDSSLENGATPSVPTAFCEGNKWIEHLYALWVDGEARHIPIQLERGKEILLSLLSYPIPIPIVSREHGRGMGCIVYGDAVRNGRAPTTFQVMTDVAASLINKRTDVVIVNSLTNEVEESSVPNIIAQIHQQSSALGKDDWSSFNFSSTYLSIIDAPSQEEGGSLPCHWTLNPFDDDTENVSGRIGTTWTFPGAITFTHMDSIGCGMNMIHWKGSKLWIIWRYSDENLDILKSLGCLRGVTDFNTVLILMRKLRDMEVLWISDDDVKDKELGFYLDLNAIHACITFTESLHAGHAVRGISLTKNLEPIVRWYTKFVTEEMMTRHGIHTEEDRGLVEDILTTLDIWEEVSNQLRKRKKRSKFRDQERMKLDAMIKNARKYLSSARAVLSSGNF